MYLYTASDEHHAGLLVSQLLTLVWVAVAGLGVLAIEYFWPDFFNYPYFSWDVEWSVVTRFWPLFAYGAVLAFWTILTSDYFGERSSFTLGAMTSILAGLWEEVAYRCIFVCYAMLFILSFNFLLSTVLGSVIGLVLLIGSFFVFERGAIAQNIGAVVAMTVGGMILYLVWIIGGDPLLWFYREITVPVINLITFGQFQGIFYNGYPELFVFGLVSANGWFRSGHEYQGFYGLVNSWIIGFVLMYAMLHYGLLVAIVLHILYDIQIDLIRFMAGR